MAKLGLRERLFWWFVDDVLKYDKNKKLNLPLKILYFFFFPLMAIHYAVGKQEGYQYDTRTWIIHGMRYSDEIFKHFSYGGDELFKIVKRENGLITIDKIDQNNK